MASNLGCCLCGLQVLEKRRKRRLHGSSCSALKLQLQDLSSVPLEDLTETANVEAFLCNSCENQLTSISNLERKLRELKANIVTKLSHLHSSLSVTPCDLRKRMLDSGDLHPAEKRARLSSETLPELPLQTVESEQQSGLTVAGPSSSPSVQVNVTYQSGTKKVFKINTPNRRKGIKKLTRGSYKSMATMMLSSPGSTKSIVLAMGRKILGEMRTLSSLEMESILCSPVDGLRTFSWDKVMVEYARTTPTLVALLQCLIPKATSKIPFMSFIISLLIKCRHQRMSLVQRAISILLYGNGTTKQIYQNLQPLNVCMSYKMTLNIVEKLSENFDSRVSSWAAELKRIYLIPQSEQMPYLSNKLPSTLSTDSSGEESECTAPSFSPISSKESMLSLSSSESDSRSMEQIRNEEECLEVEESDVITTISTEESDASAVSDISLGYRIIGDNVDKNIKPSYQRHEHRTQSFHHFHSYAVKDRINSTLLSDVPPDFIIPDPQIFLPTPEDIDSIKEELSILLSRIIVQHLEEFKNQGKDVVKHIPSKYSEEMSRKSDVVPMGVLLRDENKLDEMNDILHHFMAYVPTLPREREVKLPSEQTIMVDDTKFSKILFGGDQLTAARVRGTQALLVLSETPTDRLEGLIPDVLEDWHSRMALVDAIWKRFMRTRSVQEKGTLYQLRNLINRTSAPLDPTTNMNGAEDFLSLLLHAHVTLAAKVILRYNPTNSANTLAKRIVSNYVDLPTHSDSNLSDCEDEVYLYSTEFLTLSLIWHGYYDAIKEGDGERILRYWKYLLIIFKSCGKKNYGKEAVNLLLQYFYFFSERQKHQLLWSRCINTRGYKGANIPADLHMEHLNRRLKIMMRNLGANVTPSSIEKAGKCIGVVQNICHVFEEETSSKHSSDKHSVPKFKKDFKTILQLLDEENVFIPLCKRKHKSFDIKKPLMKRFSDKELCSKIKINIDQILVKLHSPI